MASRRAVMSFARPMLVGCVLIGCDDAEQQQIDERKEEEQRLLQFLAEQERQTQITIANNDYRWFVDEARFEITLGNCDKGMELAQNAVGVQGATIDKTEAQTLADDLRLCTSAEAPVQFLLELPDEQFDAFVKTKDPPASARLSDQRLTARLHELLIANLDQAAEMREKRRLGELAAAQREEEERARRLHEKQRQWRAQALRKKVEEEKRRRDQEKIRQAASELVKRGIATKIKPSTREACVDPLVWAIADHEQKEKIARLLAACVTGRPFGQGTVSIYDHQSGKKLAKIGIFGGFKVY